LQAALDAAEARHKEVVAGLKKEVEVERQKLENVQGEYVECKKERNKAEHEALEAEEQLRDLIEKHKLDVASP